MSERMQRLPYLIMVIEKLILNVNIFRTARKPLKPGAPHGACCAQCIYPLKYRGSFVLYLYFLCLYYGSYVLSMGSKSVFSIFFFSFSYGLSLLSLRVISETQQKQFIAIEHRVCSKYVAPLL